MRTHIPISTMHKEWNFCLEMLSQIIKLLMYKCNFAGGVKNRRAGPSQGLKIWGEGGT